MDSLIITSDDLDLEFTPLPDKPGKVKIKYVIKPETVRVKLPTTIETKTVVKVKKETPWYAYVVFGVLLLITLLSLLKR